MKHFSSILLIVLLGFSINLHAVTYCSSAAFGYGASATGGGNATPTLVSTVSELQSALNKGQNKVIIITTSLTFSSMLSVQDGANVTLMALPGVTLTSNQQDATSSGILYVKRFDNLIIRNITFIGPGAYDCDGNDLLCFENVTNAWVDHCDFQDGVDGNFDNKSLTDNVTVSWCRFRYLKPPKAGGSGGSDDHRYTNLLGSSSTDAPDDGTFNFTWAYCWWDEGCKERMVRCRNASLHFLNCYWNSSVANYYIGPENADAYVEGCYIEGNPATNKIFYQNYGGTNGVKFINCYSAKGVPSNVTDRSVLTPNYTYTALSYSEAKSAVTNSTCGAGATLTVTTAGSVSSSCDGGGGQAAPTLTLTSGQADQTVTSGNAITNIVYTASGTANDISVANLPAGLTSGKSGLVLTISGTPTATGTYTVTATNSIGATTTLEGTITVNSGGGEDPTPTGEITWNISDDAFTALTGDITSTTTVNGLTITATSDKKVTIATNSKTIEDISFTHVLKLGGAGNAAYRSLSFAVTGACTIEVYLVSAKDTETRTLNVYSGSYGGTLLAELTAGTTPAKQTYNYTGGATTIYMGSANSGINIYGINLIYSGTTPTTHTVTFKDSFGNTLKTETVSHGGAATAPTIPDVACYTPGEWDKAFNNVTSDLIVTVTYTLDRHSVTVQYEDTEGSAHIQ